MMTCKEFIADFRENVMPHIRETERQQGGGVDYPLRAETWNNTVDAMINDRQLPRSASYWNNPFDRRK